MPLYEYHCTTCGTDFEKMVRWSEMDQPASCPVCLSHETTKKVSHTASFSGSSAGGSSASASSCGSSGRFT